MLLASSASANSTLTKHEQCAWNWPVSDWRLVEPVHDFVDRFDHRDASALTKPDSRKSFWKGYKEGGAA
jgi:hypothetical protein